LSACNHKALALLVEGHLDGRARDATVKHAEGCAQCRAELRRLRGARDAFSALRGAEAPELPWEKMGAQIAWQLGREPARPRVRWPIWALGAAALATAALIFWVSRRGDGSASVASASPSAAPAMSPASSPGQAPRSPEPAPAALAAYPFLIEEEVELGRAGAAPAAVAAELVADAPLAAGDRVRAVGGRVGLLLEPGTAVVLEPGAEAALQSLDARSIEIALAHGRVTLEVARRRPEQRLSVLAAGKRVTVRGTRFAVDLSGGTLVVGVGHGRVELADGGAVLTVDGGSIAELGEGDSVAGARVRALTDDERADIEVTLPLPGALAGAELVGGTRLLRVGSSQAASLTLDGAPVGSHQALVRVLPGRHLFEASAGGRRVSRWVDVAGETGILVVHVPAPSAQKTAASLGRPQEIDRQVRGAGKAIKACYADGLARRPDLEGTVLLKFEVSSDGRLAPVEVSSSTLDDESVESCLRAIVQKWRLPPGEPTTVIYPIELHRN